MSEEQLPEAEPKSDIDPDKTLSVDGGTLVWKDPVSSGEPIPLAYLIPSIIFSAILIGIGYLVDYTWPFLILALVTVFFGAERSP